MPTRRVLVQLTVVLALALGIAAPASGETTLGTGNQPSAFTDVDGVTHAAWDRNVRGAVDQVQYCRIARGAGACGRLVDLALPGDCFKQDTKDGGSAEGDRPRVSVSRFGDVRVVTHALCTEPPVTPSLRNQGYVYRDQTLVYVSTNGGDSFAAAPERAGFRMNPYDTAFGGGQPSAVENQNNRSDYVYDEADSRLVGVESVSDPRYSPPNTSGSGVYVLADTDPDPVTSKLSGPRPASAFDADPQLVQRGRGSFAAAWTLTDRDGSDRIQVRTFSCGGCERAAVGAAGSWTPQVALDDPLGVGEEQNRPHLVHGASGTYLFYAIQGARISWWVRRITGSTVGPRQLVLAGTPNQPVSVGSMAEDPATGRLHAVIDQTQPTASGFADSRFVHLRSDDGGATWSAPTLLDFPFPSAVPVVTANTGDAGFAGTVIAGAQQFGAFTNYGIRTTLLPGLGELPPDPPTTDPPTTGPPATDPPAGGGSPGGGGQPGTPAVPGTPGVPAIPVPDESCKVRQFGPLEIVGSACLKIEKDGVIVATGTVKLNGLTLAGKEIRFDPKKRLVTSDGPVRFSIGDTRLFTIPIDWKIPAGSTFVLPSVGLPDAGRLFGFPLQGSVDVKLVRGGVELPLHLGLPKLFGGFTGDVTVRADNVSGIRLRELKVKAGKALLGPLELDDVSFEYDSDAKRWAGAATLLIPPKPPSPALAGKVAFAGGELESLGGELTFPGDGIPLDSFKLTHLTKIRFSLETKPDLKLTGGVSFGAGAKFGQYRAVEVDGDMSFRFPSRAPAVLRADGLVKLLTIPVGRSYAQFRTDGQVSFGGRVDYKVGTFGVSGAVDGWVLPPSAFSVDGSVRVCLGDLGCEGGEVAISSKGMAACAYTSLADFGAGYEWGPSLAWSPSILLDIDYMFRGCSVADYVVAPPPATGRATGTGPVGAGRAVPVEKDLPFAVFGITGTNAAPRVALVSPSGRRIETPADGPLKTAGVIAFHVPEKHQTFVVVKRPEAGTWRVQSLDAEPITSLGHAAGLPDPKVRARVSGTGRDRRLDYAITPLPGQTVRFEERSAKAAGIIGAPRRTTGRLRFDPASGPAGRRDVVAVVQSYGKPRTELKVASYVAPPPRTPARPAALRIKRGKNRLTVSWRRQPRLSRYRLVVRLADGRGLLLLPGGKAGRATIPRVGKAVGGSVTLTGEFADGTLGRSSRAAIKAQKTTRPAKKTPGKTRKPGKKT